MIAELYDALVAAGSPEDKARAAAEAMAGYEAYQERFIRIESDVSELRHDLAVVRQDVSDLKHGLSDIDRRLSAVERDTHLLKWMVGFVLAMQVAMLFKLFLH